MRNKRVGELIAENTRASELLHIKSILRAYMRVFANFTLYAFIEVDFYNAILTSCNAAHGAVCHALAALYAFFFVNLHEIELLFNNYDTMQLEIQGIYVMHSQLTTDATRNHFK